MAILHISLEPIDGDRVEFRYFWEHPTEYRSHQRSLAELKERVSIPPKDYVREGQALYNWLDGSDRILQTLLQQHQRESIVLAIAAAGELAQFPWELLHDGGQFLVERRPAIVPVRWVGGDALTVQDQPKNRYLNVLFMATSPTGVEPQLDFEAEEGRILEATQNRRDLCLEVEESGNVEELGKFVSEYGAGYFDIVHLTGHATIEENQPYFITETEYGEPTDSSAKDLAGELQFQIPKLIFLSGCRRYFDKGAVSSLAQELLNNGATAVLGWESWKADTEITEVAATFYQQLSLGRTVTEALATTYQTSIGQRWGREWHRLRFYVAESLPGALVTPPRTRGRQPAPRPTATSQFVDARGILRLLPRSEFVGRRRRLQNCLQILKQDKQKVGVLLQGFGGWGKSAIAARLCDRLSDCQPLVFWRQELDGNSLVQRLAENLRHRELREQLQDPSEELKYRLRDVFEELHKAGEQPWLFVLDDFEWNLERRGESYVLQQEIARVLEALIWAIRKADAFHRIIITCRYDFESSWRTHFYRQEMDNFHHSDLQKKLKRLDRFHADTVDEGLKQRALKLADGNPRLLEWLNNDVLSQDDAEAQLTYYETRTDAWREKVIWNQENQPVLQIDDRLEQVLSRLLVYQIHVPMSALEAVCESISDARQQIERARDKGLIGVDSANELYRVSHIIPCQLPQQPDILYPLYRKASEALSQCWENRDNRSEERWREIFRLLFADKENPQRFRQGFHKMLAVQWHPQADSAYERELRQVAEEIVEDNLYTQLETYLQQGQWREADEETAFIFYQVMVSNGYINWEDLLEDFPSHILTELDQLWVSYSYGHFGFSIQEQIWESVGGSEKPSDYLVFKTLEKFGEQVGWYDREKDEWIAYRSLPFTTTTAKPAALPNFCFRFVSMWWVGWGVLLGWCGWVGGEYG